MWVPLLLFLPRSSAFQPHPLELWVVQVHSNLNHMFWHLEKSVGCVEKPEMVTRRGEKSDQQLGTALLQGLDSSTNSIVVGARGGQPCSKMPRVIIPGMRWTHLRAALKLFQCLYPSLYIRFYNNVLQTQKASLYNLLVFLYSHTSYHCLPFPSATQGILPCSSKLIFFKQLHPYSGL